FVLAISWTAFSAGNDPERQFAERVSERQLLQRVRALVAIGNRMGGTVSGDSAAAYVFRAFQRFGVEPELIVEPPKMTFTNERWTLEVVQPRRLRNVFRHEWLAGFSPSVESTEGAVAFFGPGESLEETDLLGKVVLSPLDPEGEFAELMAEAGAKAILSYFPDLPGKYADWAMITNLPASAENRIPVFNISRGNGETLRREVESGTEVTVRFASSTTIERRRPRTVLATIQGELAGYYLVCAHGDSDSGGPGADDNASGVSAVLELARVLQGMINDGVLPRPKYSVRFAVWGSEYFSTAQYVFRNEDRLEDILGVLNYDEIGTGATRNALYFESNDVPHNASLLRTLEKVGEDFAGRKGFWEESTTNPSQGGTDSYVFLPDYLSRLRVREVEIPSVTIYTAAWNEIRTLPQTPGWTSSAWKGHPDSVTIDYSEYYHSSLDTPGRTTEREPWNMTGAVKAVGIALLRMAWDIPPRKAP
ncbi:MAG: M28 family peptidase, partial [Bacteroidota bacterium]